MKKNHVVDMLHEMIEPKISNKYERFSRGGLKSEDINTLLLISQYNHISHYYSKISGCIVR